MTDSLHVLDRFSDTVVSVLNRLSIKLPEGFDIGLMVVVTQHADHDAPVIGTLNFCQDHQCWEKSGDVQEAVKISDIDEIGKQLVEEVEKIAAMIDAPRKLND